MPMKLPENDQQPSIDPGWLQERYRFDTEARCRELEKSFLEYFQGTRLLRIVDVGAGLGANTRYYLEVIPFDQLWTLVEYDPVLVQQCFGTLSQWAKSRGWLCEITADSLTIHLPDKQAEIRVLKGSMLDLEHMVDLTYIDLVTANAVFDLFSQQQFQRFVKLLTNHRVPILTTLNYQSMVFEPEDQQDGKYVRHYQSHMRRLQDFGAAMGAGCSRHMITVLESLGGSVQQGKSVWKITSAEPARINYMLHFMQEAISELLTFPEELNQLNHWIISKHKRLLGGAQKLIVKHMDLFGTFSKKS